MLLSEDDECNIETLRDIDTFLYLVKYNQDVKKLEQLKKKMEETEKKYRALSEYEAEIFKMFKEISNA